MLAYLGLLQVAPVIRETVGQKVVDARQDLDSDSKAVYWQLPALWLQYKEFLFSNYFNFFHPTV